MKITFQKIMLWLRGEQQSKEDGDPYVPPPWRDQPNVIDAPEPAKPTPTAVENREAARKLRIAAEARRRDPEIEQANRVMLKPPGRPHPGVPSPYEAILVRDCACCCDQPTIPPDCPSCGGRGGFGPYPFASAVVVSLSKAAPGSDDRDLCGCKIGQCRALTERCREMQS